VPELLEKLATGNAGPRDFGFSKEKRFRGGGILLEVELT